MTVYFQRTEKDGRVVVYKTATLPHAPLEQAPDIPATPICTLSRDVVGGEDIPHALNMLPLALEALTKISELRKRQTTITGAQAQIARDATHFRVACDIADAVLEKAKPVTK